MRKYRIEEKEFSDINITPFTDVVLVLLLIFMISSPFLVVTAFKVKLPEATTAESITSEKNMEIYLDANNKLYLNGNNVVISELLIQVQLELQKDPEKSVIIKADKESFHGNFISLLDELKKAGVTKFFIGTKRKS
ncbi:MAG: biopolymer transporter ExbD [bacterium]